MPDLYSYSLKSVENRKKTDLKKYKEPIEDSIKNIFGDRVIDISVYKTFFEFSLSDAASDVELRLMGREIARNESELNDIKKEYGYSTQLLQRVKYDLVLRDRCDNNLIAIVEVKASDTNVDSAKKNFRNMLAHGLVPEVRYFLLVTQDNGYVWSDVTLLKKSEPDMHFPMKNIIGRYVKKNKPLRHDELELILMQWFNDLSQKYIDNENLTVSENKLLEIGFIDEIRNSKVISEVEL